MVSHRWQPLEGLDSQSSGVDFQEVDSLHRQWLNVREHREELNPDVFRAFSERVGRRWAIETGIIEGIYNIDRGTTETLVEKGLLPDLIEHGSTDRDPQELVKVLKDHQGAAEFVTEAIRRQTPLSKHYISELHQILTRNQSTYTVVDQFGTPFEAELDRGGFKKQPNNPTRPDGWVHEYCPPIQVESELDNLVDLYGSFQDAVDGRHTLLVAAWLHHRFTEIHPFQDGNGRVARALLTWHLAREGYLPIVISRDDRKQYIESLEAADAGDLDPFVEFIVRLERRMILEALDEPDPVTDSGLVDQVVDHIIEQIGRRNQVIQAQMRSVNAVAASIQGTARSLLESRAQHIRQRLEEAGLPVECLSDWGGPGIREHWYHAEVVQTAKDAGHWANFSESRFFIKLSMNPEQPSQTPRLILVVSLHHVGRQLTGIMAATAFVQIINFRDPIAEGAGGPAVPDFITCPVDPFTFTWQDNAETISPRFTDWIEGPLSIALRQWSAFIA